jgi:hypothetical protein
MTAPCPFAAEASAKNGEGCGDTRTLYGGSQRCRHPRGRFAIFGISKSRMLRVGHHLALPHQKRQLHHRYLGSHRVFGRREHIRLKELNKSLFKACVPINIRS